MAPEPAVIEVEGPLSPELIGRLCERVRALLTHTGASVVVCDVNRVAKLDAIAVDALARMQLTASREGGAIVVRHACPGLRDLLDLAGLTDVIALTGE